jgi:hypothetical protein
MTVNLKNKTPKTTLPPAGVLFGADSTSAESPDIYTGAAIVNAVEAGIGADAGAQAAIAEAIADNLNYTQEDGVSMPFLWKLRDYIAPEEYDVAMDGTTDDTGAWQDAIDAARTYKKPIKWAGGVSRIAGSLDLSRVKIEGPGVFSRNVTSVEYGTQGATFLLTGTTESPFMVADNGGINLEGINFYWPDQEVDTTPIAYPALFSVADGGQLIDLSLDRCVVVNSYDLMHRPAGAAACGDIRIGNSRIFAMRRTFDFAGWVQESIFIDKTIFSPGVFQNEAVFGNSAYLRNWHAENGTWLRKSGSDTVDGMRVVGSLIFGPRYAFDVVGGGLFDFSSTGTTFDATATFVRCTGSAVLSGFKQTGGSCYLYKNNGGTEANTGYEIDTTGVVDVSISGVDHLFCGGNLFDVRGTGVEAFTVGGGNIGSWGSRLAPSDAYALYCDAANARVTFKPGSIKGGAAENGISTRFRSVKSADVGGTHFAVKHAVLTDAALTSGIVRWTGDAVGTFGAAAFSINSTSGTFIRDASATVDKLNGSPAWPVSVRNAGTQTFGAGPTVALFGTIVSEFDMTYSAGVITAAHDGLYQFDVSISHDNTNAASPVFGMEVVTTGVTATTFRTFKTLPAAFGKMSLAGTVFLDAGDTFKVNVFRNSGTGDLVSINDGACNYVCLRRM